LNCRWRSLLLIDLASEVPVVGDDGFLFMPASVGFPWRGTFETDQSTLLFFVSFLYHQPGITPRVIPVDTRIPPKTAFSTMSPS